jgi:hypothetical protein
VIPQPLEVQPRWLVHTAFLFALLLVVAVMAALGRGELELDDELVSVVLLVLGFWLFALGLGALVRYVRAGYALRLDAAGLHIPGLEVIPWSAVRDARLGNDSGGAGRFRKLVVAVEPGYSGGSLRHYERYLFGPVAGLFGARDTIAIPVHLLAVAPDALLATAQAFIAARSAQAKVHGAGARRHRLCGRRQR